MDNPLDRFRAALKDVQDELDRELRDGRERLRYRIERGKAVFDAEILARHRAMKVRLPHFLARARWAVILTAPLIYMLIVPLALLDLFVAMYQAICFPIYGIERVRRVDHMVIDRHRLAYLNGLQKLNCLYCSYANGLISLVREVAARTEQYWCPIRHARRPADPHDRYADFAAYGDAENFESRQTTLRDNLRQRR